VSLLGDGSCHDLGMLGDAGGDTFGLLRLRDWLGLRSECPNCGARFKDSHVLGRELVITAYKYPTKSKLELEAEFNSLAAEWRAETRMLSLVTQKSMHAAYQRIIGMGPAVVPLILRDLEQKPDRWFWALRAITGDNPVKLEKCDRMKLMAQAWIEWGKEHGYEW